MILRNRSLEDQKSTALKSCYQNQSMDLMSSMNTDHVDIEKVTYFVLHVIYNRPKRATSPGDIEKAKKMKVCTYKIIAA